MGETPETAQSLFAPLTTTGERTGFSLKDLVAEFPNHHNDWTIQEAFLCLILSTAFADGRVVEEEQEEIRALAHRSRTLKNMTLNELAEANRVVLRRRAERSDWLLEVCEALPRDMHLAVFAHCLDIALADGVLVQAEAEFLETLIENLSITPEDAGLITKVVSLKNRY